MVENARAWRALRWATSVAFAVALATPTAHAEEADHLADELIRMRGEVEELHTRLASAKEQHLSRMGALARERGDLEADVNRERLVVEELESTIAQNRAAADEAGMDDTSLAPAVLDAVGQARAYVASSLPFQVRERQAALDEIERQVRTGAVPATKAVNRVWAFYEDELRLTRENGLYRQSITIDGETKLADVARLGMVMMFFRTGDGSFGKVVPSAGAWSFEPIADAADRERVAALFDSLEKQVRTGYFELPNVLDVSGGAS